MFPTGHIASALLASRLWALDSRIAIAATLFPDIVDKGARHVLGVVPYGRIPAHALLVLALTTAVAFVLDRRARQGGRWVAAWLAGYGLHLLLDFANVVPMLWPFRDYTWPAPGLVSPESSPIAAVSFVLELALIAAAIGVETRRRRRARQASGRQCSPGDQAPRRL